MALTAVYAGTSGGLRSINITPDLTVDLPTYTGSTVVKFSITSWKRTDAAKGEMPEFVTFNTTADAQGVLGPQLARGGVKQTTFAVEGIVDRTETALFEVGPFAIFDFFDKKVTGANEGYAGVHGRIEGFSEGTSVTQAVATCSFTFKVDGICPAFSSSIT